MIILPDVPQFGFKKPHVDYPPRPCVYGIAKDVLGRIAIAQIGIRPPFEYDLPGGGLDDHESEQAALIREFREETGLMIRPISQIARANQYWGRDDVKPRNSEATFMEVFVEGDRGVPSEPDHRLVWMSPALAALHMRHDAHAWAILKWLRLTFDGQPDQG